MSWSNFFNGPPSSCSGVALKNFGIFPQAYLDAGATKIWYIHMKTTAIIYFRKVCRTGMIIHFGLISEKIVICTSLEWKSFAAGEKEYFVLFEKKLIHQKCQNLKNLINI